MSIGYLLYGYTVYSIISHQLETLQYTIITAHIDHMLNTEDFGQHAIPQYRYTLKLKLILKFI